MSETFHYEIQGITDGPWLTFIPGIGNDTTFWSEVMQRLGGRYRILGFDLWGHGKSPPPPSRTFDGFIAAIGQMWDDLGITSTAVIGLGFGGSAALATALAFPDQVARVAACCCRPRQPDDRREFWRNRRSEAERQGMQAMAQITVDRWFSPAFRAEHPQIYAQMLAMFRRTSLPGYQAYLDMFVEMDFDSRLNEIQRPTLLVAGEHDTGGGPVPDMVRMAQAIPGARLEIIPGTGHLPPIEAPDAFARVLDTFL